MVRKYTGLVMVTVRMTPEQRDELNQRAQEEDRTLNGLCLRALFPGRAAEIGSAARRMAGGGMEALANRILNKPAIRKEGLAYVETQPAEIATGGIGDYFPK